MAQQELAKLSKGPDSPRTQMYPGSDESSGADPFSGADSPGTQRLMSAMLSPPCSEDLPGPVEGPASGLSSGGAWNGPASGQIGPPRDGQMGPPRDEAGPPRYAFLEGAHTLSTAVAPPVD